MRKRFSFFAVPLLLSGFLATSTVETQAITYFDVEDMVIIFDIMTGDENGDLNLYSQITRAEFVAMVSNMLVHDKTWTKPTYSPYPDVTPNHWASSYIAYGLQEGLVNGYVDGTFRPENPITLGEASVMIPTLLGYSTSDFTGYSMDGRVAWMGHEGLLENVSAQYNTDVISREDTMYLFYNALTAPMKTGSTIYQNMGYSLDSEGEIDHLALLDTLTEGPTLVVDGWEEKLPFALSDVSHVVVDGITNRGSISDIKEDNLVYWVDVVNALWVYQKKITGPIEAVDGTSINIAGTTYPLETEDVKFAVSNLGTYKKGDWVTAVFGKSGGVAELFYPDLDGSGIMVGVVTKVGTTTHTDSLGGTYEGPSVTIFATDGETYTFATDDLLYATEGAIMEVTVDYDGSVNLKNYRYTEKVQGYINPEGTTMGKYNLASDIEIIDVYENTGASISVDRISNMIIDSDEVAYYSLNTQGQIDRLILKDVTGEMHTYAILDRMAELGSGTSFTMQYDLIVGGIGKTSQYVSTRYQLEKGAVLIKGDISDLDGIVNLRTADITRLDSAFAVMNNTQMPLSENLVVWEKQGNNYYQSTLQRLLDVEFETMTGYYVSNSDRYVRVIVAEK